MEQHGSETYERLASRHAQELGEAMGYPEFAFDAFSKEMADCEYHERELGCYEVLVRFGRLRYSDGKGEADYLAELGLGEAGAEAYYRAKADYLRACREDGRL